MSNIVVIYHAHCADGFTAAWAARKSLEDSATYIPATHGSEPPDDISGKKVYLLDFAYGKGVMEDIALQASEVIVLDHHVSAQKHLEPLMANGTIRGIFDMDRSGAMIAWEYFHPDKPIPMLVKYVQDRDLWKFELPHSKETAMGIQSYEFTYENWDQLALAIEMLDPNRGILDASTGFLREATAVYRKHMKEIRTIIETDNSQIMCMFDGQLVPLYNASHCFGSDLCATVIEETEHKIAGYFVQSNKGTTVGLRSALDGPNVADLAMLYGGGGHKHAAGFRIDNIERSFV